MQTKSPIAYFHATLLDEMIFQVRALEYDLKQLEKAGYKPDQQRVPRGQPDGGQWIDTGHPSVHKPTSKPPYDPPIEPVYPIESALTVLSAGQMLVALRSIALLGRSGGAIVESNINRAAKAIEEYLGGPGKFIRNKHGDTVIIRGNRKIRFDIKNTSGDKPHFQIEKETPSGNWRNAGRQHRYYFKEND
ncbi:MAG: hypothetical protein U1E36_06880 [Rickettsiales bacterium]